MQQIRPVWLIMPYLIASATFAGNEIGANGDRVSAHFVSLGRALITSFETSITLGRPLLDSRYVTGVRSVLESTRVVCNTDSSQFMDTQGNRKDLKVVDIGGQTNIMLNCPVWTTMMDTKKTDVRTILHGYLYAAGFDDYDYQISSLVDSRAFDLESLEEVKLPYRVSHEINSECASFAGRFAKLIADQEDGPKTGIRPYQIASSHLQESYTWAGEGPGNGQAEYTVSVISEDGWDCLYHMEIDIRPSNSSGYCALRSIRFDHCAK